MKTLIYISAALLLFAGCSKDFDELREDTNRPADVPASLVLSGVLNDFTQSAWNDVQRWNQYNACNYNYYGNQEYNWTNVSYDSYNTLKNIMQMEKEAARTANPDLNPYRALGKFFRAYFFYNLTMRVGDLPMGDALQGLENTAPKYDSQKDIFIQVLAWLEESNTDLAALIAAKDESLTGDYYYEGDLAQWQKAINSFKLRVLVQLSLKETDTNLAIKTKFAEVYTNAAKYPVFTRMEDNLQYVYNNVFNKYPTNPDNFGFDATRYNMSATYLNTLAALKDPRAYITAEPAAKKVSSGMAPTDFGAFVGASSGEDLADMSSKAGSGEYSFINRRRYYSTYTAEPNIQIGYPELCFNIAEAINRGWISGSAEEWYRKGLEASIAFYGITPGSNAVYFQTPGGDLNDYDTYQVEYDPDAYYSQPAIKYAGNNANGLRQILLQKYLAFFQNSGWEAYYNWRRTKVPEFLTGPGTGNSERVAMRFLYPVSETATNGANLQAALQSQFGGADDINGLIWVVK